MGFVGVKRHNFESEIDKKEGEGHVHVRMEMDYRVTIPLVQNLPLTSKQKFRFGLAMPGQIRPKRNSSFEDNGRF